MDPQLTLQAAQAAASDRLLIVLQVPPADHVNVPVGFDDQSARPVNNRHPSRDDSKGEICVCLLTWDFEHHFISRSPQASLAIWIAKIALSILSRILTPFIYLTIVLLVLSVIVHQAAESMQAVVSGPYNLLTSAVSNTKALASGASTLLFGSLCYAHPSFCPATEHSSRVHGTAARAVRQHVEQTTDIFDHIHKIATGNLITGMREDVRYIGALGYEVTARGNFDEALTLGHNLTKFSSQQQALIGSFTRLSTFGVIAFSQIHQDVRASL